MASRTITKKMDSTTDKVVCRPTLSALRATRSPSRQPTRAMTSAKNGALMRPSQNVQPVIAEFNCERKSGSGIRSCKSQSAAPPNQLPVVSLTAPAGGATFTAPATISVTAQASDPENRLARVEFYAGATRIGSVAVAPFKATWTSAPAGTYALTAVAFDLDGGSATSAPVTVNVVASGVPSTVSFQKSADHATLVTYYLLEVFAAGANPSTATPIAALNLGKPTPAADGSITLNESAFFSALAKGSYIATVSAVGSGGKGRSLQVSFTR